jgi:membrane protein implicated in regulation of membrane protease activity
MIWMSAFALSFWSVAILLQSPAEDLASGWDIVLVVGRNALISLIPTKLLTQPLRGKFDSEPPNPDKGMVGRPGVVVSIVTTTNGQVEIETGGAPLVLHARTTEGEIAKGDPIVIVDYDSETRIFEVEKYSS